MAEKKNTAETEDQNKKICIAENVLNNVVKSLSAVKDGCYKDKLFDYTITLDINHFEMEIVGFVARFKFQNQVCLNSSVLQVYKELMRASTYNIEYEDNLIIVDFYINVLNVE